ncbi:RNA--NAD 2'-phosphotransferase [Rhizobium sp. S9]|uniref:RNA 2'-phosphotransferase n=1 Tax=Rhizobium sp. S9 TaxID=2035454 RepID=UPI000BE7B4F7|nr:RNA 2'-phosphotransferase [Rhizobium sp. S9]PDS95465.1 RNA--NAD 2'-phosphotransferase [Rhizobium sp. S9]
MSKELSKFLSLILRHEPAKFGVVLDGSGWTPIDPLITQVRVAGFPDFDRETLDAVVENDSKKRFTISNDGLRIRAAQGHSVEVDLGLNPSKPPAALYHGTAIANVDSIRENGLLPGKRQHVHLSSDYDTAINVGARYGKPVVLSVDAERMFADGINFIQAENGVWLTDVVPAQYLIFDPRMLGS